MANRFIGGVLSSRPQANTPFVSRASTGTYFDSAGTLVTATSNQPRLNYSFVGSPIDARHSGLFAGASNLSVAQTTATDLGSANFTIEMWIYFTGQNTAGTTNNNICGKWNSGTQWILQFRAAGLDSIANQHWRFYFNGSSGTDFQEVSTTAVELNRWHHIAVVRSGSSFIFYRNGVQIGSTFTSSATITSTSDTMTIGAAQNNAYGVTGYISNFRMVTGTAVYTGAFTVPTGILTATQSANPFGGSNTAAIASGTQVLTLQNSGFTDYSSNNFTLTNTSVVARPALPPLNYTSDFSGTGWSNPTVLIEPASTNLTSYSEQFDNAFWTKGGATVTANSITAPDGTLTADTLTETATTGEHIVYYGFSSDAAYYTLSVFAKAGTRGWITLYANGIWQSFNLVAGVIGTTGSSVSATITPVGNGWYRCAVTRLMTATNNYWQLNIATGDNTSLSSPVSYAGSTSGSVYIWGAQVEKTYGATSYIQTIASAITRAQDNVGPGTSGIFGLEDRQNTTANDDQSTVTSFTSTGSTTWTAPLDVTSVEVLVVAGGGGGGGGEDNVNGDGGGGGGAGGLLYNTSYPVTPGTTYPVVVGAGGSAGAQNANGGRGTNSQFGNIIALGGGNGSGGSAQSTPITAGGSGGGASYDGGGVLRRGSGTPGQGYDGGSPASNRGAGGGGGAGGAGKDAYSTVADGSRGRGGDGGNGLYFNITGTSTAYAGGGGGCPSANFVTSGTFYGGTGGTGGGGNAYGSGGITYNSAGSGTAGTANTGGGGGGGYASSGGAGGSGIVVVKYKRTPKQISSTSNAATVVQKFIVSNVWTAPAGVTSVEALVVAGGGGGGNGTSGGGGGAGGVVYNSTLAVTPGSTYTIGVGSGGLGAIVAGGTTRNGTGSGIGSGSELITNGSNFTTGTGTTGWTATTATLSVPQNGIFQILPNASVNGTASQSITTVNGTKYLLVVNVLQDTTQNLRVRIGTTQVGSEIDDNLWPSYILTETAVGTGIYSTVFTATGATTWINLQVGGGTQQSTQITSISVRQAALSAFGGGGGGGESATTAYKNGQNGGSGGGSVYNSATAGTGVAGQGNAGGVGYSAVGNVWTGGGGGGAGSAGGNATTFYPGYGGAGVAYSITGNLEYYGGGGGGSSQNYGVGTVYPGLGGIGGGGTGFADQTSSTVGKGGNGAPNTGGGGGAQADAAGSENSGHGGSGVVILRYRVPQVATFLDSGAWTCPAGVTSVQALIVAGGGGGANKYHTGGGGAGGLLYSTSVAVTPGTTYPVVIGQGGFYEQNGKNSSFAGLVAIGGGYGGKYNGIPPSNGGSGGGAGYNAGYSLPVGQGVYGQGNNGGNITTGDHGGGGGGAGSAGSIGNTVGGAGGSGLQYSISGTATYYAGGGGGGNVGGGAGAGGVGGGGAGTSNTGLPGTQNTGGGGGGGERNETNGYGGRGGSGIVIIRWNGG